MDQQAVIDNELALAMSDIVEFGRLGSTRFIRCIGEVRSEVNLETVADGWHMAFRRLIGSEPSRQVVSGDEEFALTGMTNWPGAQSAILVVGRTQEDMKPSTDLMIVGSKGAAYYSE